MLKRYAMVFVLLSLVSVPLSAMGQSPDDLTLAKAVADIAKAIGDVARKEKFDNIVVTGFKNPFNLNQTGGVGLKFLLIEELKKVGLTAGNQADVRVEGEFETIEGGHEVEGVKRVLPVARINFKVSRRGSNQPLLDSGKDLEESRRPLVAKPEDIAVMTGPTVFHRPNASPAEKDEKYFESEKGKGDLFKIQGAKVRAKGAPYVIEMLVANTKTPKHEDFQPRKLETRDGHPFLRVTPNEAVAVRIINEADHDLAATVTIDGLSMFTFQNDKAAIHSNLIIFKKTAGDVLGWFRDNAVSDTFLVSELPKTPSGDLLKNPADIGSITVTFAAAWENDDQRPSDEPPGREASLEIKKGSPIDAPYKNVKRHVGAYRGAVTIRYDR